MRLSRIPYNDESPSSMPGCSKTTTKKAVLQRHTYSLCSALTQHNKWHRNCKSTNIKYKQSRVVVVTVLSPTIKTAGNLTLCVKDLTQPLNRWPADFNTVQTTLLLCFKDRKSCQPKLDSKHLEILVMTWLIRS